MRGRKMRGRGGGGEEVEEGTWLRRKFEAEAGGKVEEKDEEKGKI